MLITAGYIVVCVLLFALAILIHEFGHFIVALKLGLRVEAFSIGFGAALWKKRINGVEYRIGAIPLGGYVSIPDVDPEGTKALEGGGAADAAVRAKIPAWKELLVAVAGPFMNLVLAAVLAVGLALVPGAKFGVVPLDVVRVLPGGPGEKAGLLPGDRIVAVNGNRVASKSDLQTEFLIARGRVSELTVMRGGTNAVLCAEPKFESVGPVAEIPLLYVELAAVEGGAGAPWMTDRSPLKQLAWDAGSIFRVLKGLVTPSESKATSQAIGGPVMIAEGLYCQVRNNVWDGIGFLRFLNVNLAVLNLLPIPVLDGGLILFALFALVCRRRVPDSVVKYLSLIFMVLLMGLMGLLILRDGWRSYRIHTYKGAETNAVGSAGCEVMTNGNGNATSQGR
ncbi:MAG: M50 family metallopeptidase [Kiritimatiellia bacterium]